MAYKHTLNRKILTKVRQMCESEEFNKWYNQGKFDKYISGEDSTITTEQIEQDLYHLIGLADIH